MWKKEGKVNRVLNRGIPERGVSQEIVAVAAHVNDDARLLARRHDRVKGLNVRIPPRRGRGTGGTESPQNLVLVQPLSAQSSILPKLQSVFEQTMRGQAVRKFQLNTV
jgi:hypothetical protein